MPGSVKVGNSWKTTSGLSVKVAGTWHTATSAYVKVGGTWKQWFASVITDSFNRSSTFNGLGTSDTGQPWTTLRGNWRIGGSNSALSEDSASTYPISSVNFGSQDATSKAEITPGNGVAFWITDADNWWAAVSFVTSITSSYQYTYTCQSCYQTTCYQITSYGCSCGNGSPDSMNCSCNNATPGTPASPGTYNCLCPSSTAHSVYCGTTCSSCSGACPSGGPAGCTGCLNVGTLYVTCYGNCYYRDSNCFCNNATPGTPGSAATYTCACGNGSAPTYTCACYSGYACTQCTNTTCTGTGYTTTYNYYLRLISSVGGVISNPVSDINLGTNFTGISPHLTTKVTTLGNQITASAYSDTGYTAQLGTTLSYTPVSPARGTSVGILKYPSAAQGTTIDNFSASI